MDRLLTQRIRTLFADSDVKAGTGRFVHVPALIFMMGIQNVDGPASSEDGADLEARYSEQYAVNDEQCDVVSIVPLEPRQEDGGVDPHKDGGSNTNACQHGTARERKSSQHIVSPPFTGSDLATQPTLNESSC
ncbi:MAG: hypothetical protein K6T83_09440 [Alicyclobacillus sp.]|nr:hypothetical protein [Alicyclobacillus sp.]